LIREVNTEPRGTEIGKERQKERQGQRERDRERDRSEETCDKYSVLYVKVDPLTLESS
jgi:hypothetical protein